MRESAVAIMVRVLKDFATVVLSEPTRVISTAEMSYALTLKIINSCVSGNLKCVRVMGVPSLVVIPEQLVELGESADVGPFSAVKGSEVLLMVDVVHESNKLGAGKLAFKFVVGQESEVEFGTTSPIYKVNKSSQIDGDKILLMVEVSTIVEYSAAQPSRHDSGTPPRYSSPEIFTLVCKDQQSSSSTRRQYLKATDSISQEGDCEVVFVCSNLSIGTFWRIGNLPGDLNTIMPVGITYTHRFEAKPLFLSPRFPYGEELIPYPLDMCLSQTEVGWSIGTDGYITTNLIHDQRRPQDRDNKIGYLTADTTSGKLCISSAADSLQRRSAMWSIETAEIAFNLESRLFFPNQHGVRLTSARVSTARSREWINNTPRPLLINEVVTLTLSEECKYSTLFTLTTAAGVEESQNVSTSMNVTKLSEAMGTWSVSSDDQTTRSTTSSTATENRADRCSSTGGSVKTKAGFGFFKVEGEVSHSVTGGTSNLVAKARSVSTGHASSSSEQSGGGDVQRDEVQAGRQQAHAQNIRNETQIAEQAGNERFVAVERIHQVTQIHEVTPYCRATMSSYSTKRSSDVDFGCKYEVVATINGTKITDVALTLFLFRHHVGNVSPYIFQDDGVQINHCVVGHEIEENDSNEWREIPLEPAGDSPSETQQAQETQPMSHEELGRAYKQAKEILGENDPSVRELLEKYRRSLRNIR